MCTICLLRGGRFAESGKARRDSLLHAHAVHALNLLPLCLSYTDFEMSLAFGCHRDVRCFPNSGHTDDRLRCPKSVNCGSNLEFWPEIEARITRFWRQSEGQISGRSRRSARVIP